MDLASPTRYCLALALLFSLSFTAFATSTTTTPAKPAPTSGSSSKAHTTTKYHSTTHTASKTTAHKSTTQTTGKSRNKKGKKTARKRGQQVIDPARAREIQEALIREHYLNGEPSGTWDSATQAAMQRYQERQGWQSKTTPDSRALIKLGLGPSHDHLLNPESAMTSQVQTPPPVHTQPPTQAPTPPETPPADSKKATKPTPTPDNIPHH